MPEIMECHRTTWAVRREMLPVLGALSNGQFGRLSEMEAAEQAATLAASSTQRLTGGVAVLSLTGLITPQGSYLSYLFGGSAGGLQQFRAEFRDAVGNDDVGAVLIDVDSPGGLIDLVPETAAEIRAARGGKPIVAIANTLAASAAYWIGAQADELVVTPSGNVGSIGVYSVHDDWSVFNEQFGVKPTYVSAGKYKVERNPDNPLSDEAQAAMQATVDEYYGMFTGDVAAGRGTTVDAVASGYGEGRVLTASKALALGMVDRIDTFEATVGRLIGTPTVEATTASARLAHAAAVEDTPPVVESDDQNPKADPADETSPPRGGGDPEQGARIADVLFS
jgi:signal peptide peptidase SppA